jgi:outer membrane protein insertion porin family
MQLPHAYCPKFVLTVFPRLFLLFFLGCLTAHAALAAEQNTAFVPFKINAPDVLEMTARVDEAMQRELAGKNYTLLSRDEAQAIVNYAGAWPPDYRAIETIAEQTGHDYVAIGSLTQIGEQISIDIQVYDILAPGTVHASYRDSIGVADLDPAIRATVSDVLGFTSRTFLISSIAPSGNVRIDSGAILRKITSRPGDLYNPAQLREDLKAVFSMGYFDNVEIVANDTDKGKEIIFHVQEKPVINRVLISGTDAINEKDVRDAATIMPNTILNPTRLNEAVQKINDLYKSKGYYNTKTTVSVSYPTEDSAEVHFTVDEGKKIFIGKIQFEGNKSFSDRELQKVIETSTRGWLSWITDSGVLKMDLLQQDTARIGAFYSNNGFLEAKVGEPTVEQHDDELVITFSIEEGPRFRVGIVDIRGDLIESKEQLLARLKIREEEFLNRQVLRNDNLMLTDLYAEHGYAFAEARPKVEKAPDSNRVDIVLDIDQGPLVYFNRVDIRGNTRTRDNVIRRDLKVAEGGVFNSRAVRESTENLNRLGFFEEVSITPEPTMSEDQMDVVVDVKEQSTGQFSVGAGYSSSDNLLFMAEISENNLLGTGNRLALAANLSSVTTRFNLSYTDPRIFDTKILAGIDLFNWMREYDDYTKETWGGGIRFGHTLFEKWRISYGYTYADTDLSDVAENASIIIKRSQDIHVTSSVRVALSRDTRDRFYDATSGSVNVVSVEYAGGPFGGDAEFTKLEGSTSWLFSLPLDSVFHVKGAAGQIFENEDDKLPVYEHFYLGGLNSIRGFKSSYVSPKDPVTDERIGGDKMWYTNFEVIFPLFKEMGLKGVVFIDFGNVYDVDEDWKFDKIKKATGLGFRWLSPMGPLRLEWGYNLDPDPDDDTSVWDFSIGGVF